MKPINTIYTDFKVALHFIELPAVDSDCTALSLAESITLNKELLSGASVTVNSIGIFTRRSNSQTTISLAALGSINGEDRMFIIADATYFNCDEAAIITEALSKVFGHTYDLAA